MFIFFNELTTSDTHGENSDDTEESLTTQLHGNKTILLGFPMSCGGRLQTRAVILHYDARYRVFKRFLQLSEILYTGFDDLLAPLVDFVLLIGDIRVSLYYKFDGRLSDLLNFFGVKFIIFGVLHFVYISNFKINNILK